MDHLFLDANILFSAAYRPESPLRRLWQAKGTELLTSGYAVHTLLRLPTGIFYAQGVKANVVFFDRKPASPSPWTSKLWVYDLRTNMHFTLKTKRMQRADLDEFVACFNPPNRHERKATWSEKRPDGRWRAYGYDELVARDKCSLDLFWLKDDSLLDADNLPDPDEIAEEIAEDLRSALEQIEEILADVGGARAR